MIFERTTIIRAPLREIFDFFSAPGNLAVITPPEMRFTIVEAPDRALREGDRVRYRMKILGVPIRWTTRITMWRDLDSFADLQERGPYKKWLHTHTFRERGDGSVEMHDHVDYELPLAFLGRWVAGWWVARQLRQIFEHRATVITQRFSA